MTLDPNLIRIVAIIGVVGLLILAFTYLIDFLRPLIIAVVFIIIAYFVYRYFITGTFSF